MIGLIRRLLGQDRFEQLEPPEQKAREDALRTAERARKLAKRIRNLSDDDRRRLAGMSLVVNQRRRAER